MNINSTDNSINVSTDFSSEQLRDFIEQVRPVLSHLPEDSQEIVAAQLIAIEEEADKPTPAKMRFFQRFNPSSRLLRAREETSLRQASLA